MCSPGQWPQILFDAWLNDPASPKQQEAAVFLYGMHYYTDPCWIPGTEHRSFVAYTERGASDRENQSNAG